MPYKDKSKQRAAQLAYYYRNKPGVRAKQNRKRDDYKAWIDSYKSVPCSDCGQTYPPYVMDFDHRPGVEKLFEISRARCCQFGKEATLAEIQKCDVVCANCHRIRTHARKHCGVE